MSRERFQLLIRFIHFNNNHGILAQQDKLHKIRPLLDKMSERFQEVYKSSEHLVIDDSMIPFRGRAILRQYLSGKAHKYGLKIYKVCTSDAYTWNFKVHSGTCNEHAGFPSTESLTVTNTKCYEHEIYYTQRNV